MSSIDPEQVFFTAPNGRNLDPAADKIDIPTIIVEDLTITGTLNNQPIVGAFVFTTATQTLTNKSLDDTTTAIVDTADPTKRVAFDVGGATGTTTTISSAPTANRTLTMPDATDTLVGRATTDTLTNKTLTAPTIATINNGGILTLPTGPQTMVGRTTTDTLTNKTLTAPTIATINNGGILTLPTGPQTMVGRTTTDTLTNKTLVDSSTIIVDAADATKRLVFDVIGSTGTTTTIQAGSTVSRTYIFPPDGNFVMTEGAQTVNGLKTIPYIATGSIAELTPDTGVDVDSVNIKTVTNGFGTYSNFAPVGVPVNMSVVLLPKNAGALLAQVPDGGLVGGNARGDNAVDWSRSRINAAKVASGARSTIGGGTSNRASGVESTVSGGSNNEANGDGSSIGGGNDNTTNASWAHIGGGRLNTQASTAQYGFTGAGSANTNDASCGFIGAGLNNVMDVGPEGGAIVAGIGNRVEASHSVIGAGSTNLIAPGADYSAIVAGENGTMIGDRGFIGSGTGNAIHSSYGVIGGGSGNIINVGADYGHIGGGSGNVMEHSASYGHIGGGFSNTLGIGASLSTIGGGSTNTIDHAFNYIGGGINNSITSATFGVIGGGSGNSITTSEYGGILCGEGGQVMQDHGCILYGRNSVVQGRMSMAAGEGARALYENSVVWRGDATEGGTFDSTANDQFSLKFGEIRFVADKLSHNTNTEAFARSLVISQAQPFALLTIPTSMDTVASYVVTTVSAASTGDTLYMRATMIVKNLNNVVTIGAAFDTTSIAEGVMGAASLTYDVTGTTNFVVTITGVAATTTQWSTRVDRTFVRVNI